MISVEISALAHAGFPDLFSEPGVVRAPNGSCEASITQSPAADFKVLAIYRRRNERREEALQARDVTGAVWMANDKLVYSLGPRHGTPGVFFFDCATGLGKRLVEPITRNRTYPQGADYFELDDFSRGEDIWYYHVPDIALMATAAFRKLDFLRRMDVTDPYATHIAQAYPGARLLARADFQPWIQRDFKRAGHPGLATGHFNEDALEDFAAMFRPDPTNDTKYETVVCHALPQGGYDGCQELSGSLAAKGTVRFYLATHGRGKAVCLEDVTGRYGHRLVEKTIELKTDGIRMETDIAAGLFIYQRNDNSYWRCTTAD